MTQHLPCMTNRRVDAAGGGKGQVKGAIQDCLIEVGRCLRLSPLLDPNRTSDRYTRTFCWRRNDAHQIAALSAHQQSYRARLTRNEQPQFNTLNAAVSVTSHSFETVRKRLHSHVAKCLVRIDQLPGGFLLQLSAGHRALVSVVGCITLFTTYSPILRPMSVPTRVENR
jgi:hypothetical protein